MLVREFSCPNHLRLKNTMHSLATAVRMQRTQPGHAEVISWIFMTQVIYEGEVPLASLYSSSQLAGGP
jgi:hypothetical protein